MPLPQINLPHIKGYNFGVGIDRLSGTAMNKVVGGTATPPTVLGSYQSFEVTRIQSSEDLQQSLGVDVQASYGCAAFGAGASARFSYLSSTEVHSSCLFMTVTASVRQADLSIDECDLLPVAAALKAEHPTEFSARYGDMFARACTTGGLFVGVMRIETSSEQQAQSIEGELRGSYGMFSAEASANFKQTTSREGVRVYCSMYAEGGPKLELTDTTDPGQLLSYANKWMAAMRDDPERNSVPYEWTFSPIAIANGPLPPNEAESSTPRMCSRSASVSGRASSTSCTS